MKNLPNRSSAVYFKGSAEVAPGDTSPICMYVSGCRARAAERFLTYDEALPSRRETCRRATERTRFFEYFSCMAQGAAYLAWRDCSAWSDRSYRAAAFIVL